MASLLRRPWFICVAVLCLALAALAAINAVDQELRPEARAFFSRPAVAFAPESGWALLAGFHAPVGVEARTHAVALRLAARQRKPGTPLRPLERPLEVRAAEELLCAPQEDDCVRAFAQRPRSIDDLVADNAVLLGRYDELLGSRQLADVVEALDYYEDATPHFPTVLRIQQVRLSQAGAHAATGRTAEAVAWLEADAAFHRRWLEEAGSILTKMLAVRTLSRDLLVAGQVARSGAPLTPGQWAALDRIAAPLTVAERGVAPVLRIEAVLFAGVLDRMIADAATTSRIIEAPRLNATLTAGLMRRNATLNFAYPVFAAWTTLDPVASNALAGAIEQVEARSRAHFETDWTWAYNFAGKNLVREQKPGLSEYVYRVRDLDALAAVVRCTIALRREGVAREAAAGFVAASPACVDPYEAAPLGWDPGRGELSYRARSPLQVDRFGGRGDRVTFAAYLP
jgi:hypothetical protein